MKTELINTIANIQKSTLNARNRTGDGTIGTRVEKGLFQVVRVTYNGAGKSTVSQVNNFSSADQTIKFLDSMQ